MTPAIAWCARPSRIPRDDLLDADPADAEALSLRARCRADQAEHEKALADARAVLALPAAALAAEGPHGGHKDRTTEIMMALIFVLMIGMVLIGVLENRKH